MNKLITFLILLLLAGCDLGKIDEVSYEEKTKPSPDSRFTGRWVYSSRTGRYSDVWGDYRERSYKSMTFDNTNKMEEWTSDYKYGVKQYNSSPLTFRKWKVEGNQFCTKPFSSRIGWWCRKFEFVNAYNLRLTYQGSTGSISYLFNKRN